MATLKELIGPEDDPKGRKFYKQNWEAGKWFKPILKDSYGLWCGFSNIEHDGCFDEEHDSTWQECIEHKPYIENKPKVMRWLWAVSMDNKYWSATTIFYSDEEMAKYSSGAVKLEWTRTEFEK